MNVLILGGTAEARELARHLAGRPDLQVTSSLAGRVSRPALPVGAVRIGGFGGSTGLAAHLSEHRVGAVIDATHPFAATITRNAVAACSATGTPLLVLRRPGWHPGAQDQWLMVPDITAAAATVARHPARRVFLTTGRRDLAAFADDGERSYLVRTVDPPQPPLPPRSTLILDRGPYTVDGELLLLREHHIDLLVTKNSGGALTEAKLAAARRLQLPVVMVERPALPPAVTRVTAVAPALTWVLEAAAAKAPTTPSPFGPGR